MPLFKRSNARRVGQSPHQTRQEHEDSARSKRNAATSDPRRERAERSLTARISRGGGRTLETPDGRYRDVR